MSRDTIRPARSARLRKVSRTYRLAPERIAAAQRILGAATATEAIETALDMVVFRQQLIDGTKAMLGVKLAPPDQDIEPS